MHIYSFCANNVLKKILFSLSSGECDDFGDRSTQRGATSDSLHVDAPGSSHLSSHSEELRILSVHGKGEGPLALDSNDTLSLERGEQLVHREELTGQVGNHLLIHHPKERLPLLQLHHTPIESTHLYD